MKLYHGTTEAVARAAFANGLNSRASTGVPGNWKDNPSNPDLIYLTTAYAGYFAGCACKDGERWGIVEVDGSSLVSSFMRPDEDFIEQASRGGDLIPVNIKSMKRRTAWVRKRLDGFAHHWRDSIEGLGNVAYKGGIPGAAVTGVAIFDPASNPVVAMATMDPTITTLNFAFMRSKYAAIIRWLMGEDITPGEFGAGLTGGVGLTTKQEEAARAKLPPVMREMEAKRFETMAVELAKREGLTVMRPINRFAHEGSVCCAAPVVEANGVEACSRCGNTGEPMDHGEGG